MQEPNRHRTNDEHGRDVARTLRHDATFPERIMWSILRGRRLEGHKFKRQFSIPPFTVDFCCAEAWLVIELDGMTHVGTGAADDRRTEIIEAMGYKVIRFTNDDVLEHIDVVADEIVRVIRARSRLVAPSPQPSPGRPYGAGRGGLT